MRVLLGCVVVLAVGVFSPGLVLAEDISVDDFLPAVEGGETKVQQPAKVKLDEKADTVEAATAQDAVNAAVEQNKKEIKKEGANTENPQVGTTLINFPSGLGVVATGAASYRVVDNPVATRISQRQATIIAFTQAKKNLAAYLNGLSNESKDQIREYLSNVETKDESLTNLDVSTDSTLRQAVEMMLRGFVVYELQDDATNNVIYLSVVTTPKTRGKLARPAPNHVEAESLREGLKKVLAEVKAGLVPPVGGRVVTVPTTGETAFVGFGSSVVRANRNAAAQAKLNLNAQKIAASYAQDSLCGLVIGDQTAWQGEILESYKDQYREFDEIAKDDPLKPNAQERKKLESAREEFISTMRTTDVYKSARKGVLPPGVTVRTWFDEDNAWSHGMAVYIPSVTNAAAGIRKEIDEAKILKSIRPGAGGGKAGTGKPVSSDKVARPSKKVKSLPSGKTKKDDL